MANEFDVVLTPVTQPVVNETLEEIKAASKAFGPKRVRTPNMEVEQFDPLTVQKALERQNAVQPTIGDLVISVGIPSPIYGNCRHYRGRSLYE